MRKGLTRRKRPASVDVTLNITKMFEEFMLVKKGEGLAKRTIREHYNNFGYFKSYIDKELSADEMTTELFMGWITYMLDERTIRQAPLIFVLGLCVRSCDIVTKIRLG